MKKIITLLLSVCMLVAVLASCEAAHTHTFKTDWEKDATHHWHVCEGEECTEIADKAEHTWGTPTVTEAKERVFTCTACGQTKTEVIKTTVTAEEWVAAFDPGTNWTFKVNASHPAENATMSIIQMRDGNKFYFKESITEGEDEDSYENYAEATDTKIVSYRFDEDLQEYVKEESEGSIEEELVDLTEDFLPEYIKNGMEHFTYDETKKGYVAATIPGEEAHGLGSFEVFFEDGKFVAMSYVMTYGEVSLTYHFAFTYGDASITLPTVDDTKTAYKVRVIGPDGPVEGARVQACKGDLCLAPVMTNENGVAIFRLDKTENVQEYHVKLQRLPDGLVGDTETEHTFSENSTSLYIFVQAAAAE